MLYNIYMIMSAERWRMTMSQINAERPFQFSVLQRAMLFVAIFDGDLDDRSASELVRLRIEVCERAKPKFMILHFRSVSMVSATTLSVLAHIFVQFRAEGRTLRFCSLVPLVRRNLVDAGVIRETEIAENLSNAVNLLIRTTIGGK